MPTTTVNSAKKTVVPTLQEVPFRFSFTSRKAMKNAPRKFHTNCWTKLSPMELEPLGRTEANIEKPVSHCSMACFIASLS